MIDRSRGNFIDTCFVSIAVVPTPFASLAFHPLDGYAQSVPYHLVVFILPVHKWIYLGLFVIINLWTIVVSPPRYMLFLSPERLIFMFCFRAGRFTTEI
jgi:hypothetical protein